GLSAAIEKLAIKQNKVPSPRSRTFFIFSTSDFLFFSVRNNYLNELLRAMLGKFPGFLVYS
ncbi:MAG: hypothetical protein ACJ0Q3_09525, partial [Candidatus Azotimanducaceae bacterium]